MPTVFRSPSARRDLDEIWDYIAQDNPDAADRVLDEIDYKCQMLARQPLLGEPRDELIQRLRGITAGKYVIYYRPVGDGIDVVRVLHAARDHGPLFDI